MKKIIISILLLLTVLYSQETDTNSTVDMVSVERSDLQSIISNGKYHAIRSMLYSDLRYDMSFHFYKLSTEKFELEKGEQFIHTYKLFQKKSKHNGFTSPLIFTFEFKTENNNKKLNKRKLDFSHVLFGVGGAGVGIVATLVLILATKN